ncbi:hypothetical protein ECP03047993_3354 [Escherichia coli P0304799.3]|nr:hypothetical protein ECP03047993_3354 [Escherichia coli P0304799.3]
MYLRMSYCCLLTFFRAYVIGDGSVEGIFMMSEKEYGRPL